jgi:hypothetical protein
MASVAFLKFFDKVSAALCVSLWPLRLDNHKRRERGDTQRAAEKNSSEIPT